MNKTKYKSLVEILIASIVAFFIHKLFFIFFDYQKIEQSFYHSLTTLYFFFFICSISIVLFLLKVKSKNIDSVGNTFLLLTFLKMGLSYILLNPILNSSSQFLKVEKINFFITFALFLTIETVVTIRILNNKQ